MLINRAKNGEKGKMQRMQNRQHGRHMKRMRHVSHVLAAVLLAMALLLCGCESLPGVDKTRSDGEKYDGAELLDAAAKEESAETINPENDGDTLHGESPDGATRKKVVIGFSQLGAESDWRNANTLSMKETFSDRNGYKLYFADAQQKQTNQIMAIRTFIQQDVDYIVLAPVTETGWDTVLQEAKDANIPVVIVDRMVDVSDDSLYACWVGSNFELEGEKVTDWLRQYLELSGIEGDAVNVVNIQGTLGSTAQIGRTKALEDAVKKNGWNLLAEETGDYAQTKGQEVMASFLTRFDEINVVYCENDNEAFGAIAAIEAAGKKAGLNVKDGDILVVSFDAGEAALTLALEGKIACVGECNPLHGPRVQGIVQTLEAGATPKRLTYAEEGIFSSVGTVQRVESKGEVYPVTYLSKELIALRPY